MNKKEEIKNTQEEVLKAVKEAENTRVELRAQLTEELEGKADKNEIEAISAELKAVNEAMTKMQARVKDYDASESKDIEGDAEHKKAFNHYIRKGRSENILEQKDLSAGSDPDGGYLVLPEVSSEIVKRVFETSPMRSIAKVQTISTDSLELMVDLDSGVSGGFVGETATRSDTDTPQFDKKTIPVHEQYAQPKATQKLLDDASVNVEAWLSEKTADIFSRTENTKFFRGTGSGEPRGILTLPEDTTYGATYGSVHRVINASTSVVDLDKLIDMQATLDVTYLPNAVYLMTKATAAHISQKKDGDSNYIWQRSLAAGQPDTLNGYPVIIAPDMDEIGDGLFPIAFGDFGRAYQVVDRIGIRTLRDPFTDKPYIKFYTTKRVGGDVIDSRAFVLLETSAS